MKTLRKTIFLLNLILLLWRESVLLFESASYAQYIRRFNFFWVLAVTLQKMINISVINWIMTHSGRVIENWNFAGYLNRCDVHILEKFEKIFVIRNGAFYHFNQRLLLRRAANLLVRNTIFWPCSTELWNGRLAEWRNILNTECRNNLKSGMSYYGK